MTCMPSVGEASGASPNFARMRPFLSPNARLARAVRGQTQRRPDLAVVVADRQAGAPVGRQTEPGAHLTARR